MTSHTDPFNAAASQADTALWPSSGWFMAATVLAFVLFWPVGVAMLAWGLWHRQIKASSWWRQLRGIRVPSAPDLGAFARRQPDNAALADYLEREQQRLREEQRRLDELVKAFEAFQAAERKASDQRDFENFLKTRADGAAPARD